MGQPKPMTGQGLSSPRRRPERGRAVAVVGRGIVAALFAAVVLAEAETFGPGLLNPPPPEDAMLARAQASVVTVNVIGDGFKGSGSGFFIDDRGDVLTNYHVINEAWKVTVTTRDGATQEARLVQTNEDQDVAELRVGAHGPGLSLRQKAAVPGEPVYVLGNPGGNSPNSASKGRVLKVHQHRKVVTTIYNDVATTDAMVRPGNSGGPVVDRYGQVLGMITFANEITGEGGFILDSIFASEMVSWSSFDGVAFSPPPPLFTIEEFNFTGQCNPGCPVFAVVLNNGGPGTVTVTFVVVDSTKRTKLATCSRKATLVRGERKSLACSVSSRALSNYFNVPYSRTVWGSVSITSQVAAPLD